jgi:hypothetical protein
MTDAASPTTNTPGVHDLRTVNERPPRAVGLVPSIFEWRCRDLAVHSTVALGILLPPATTPCSSTVSTLSP